MKTTFNISEAQSQFPKIARGNSVVGISRNNKVVGFYIPRDRFESLLETMEILGNPKAMKWINASKGGKLKYKKLDLNDENFGL